MRSPEPKWSHIYNSYIFYDHTLKEKMFSCNSYSNLKRGNEALLIIWYSLVISNNDGSIERNLHMGISSTNNTEGTEGSG